MERLNTTAGLLRRRYGFRGYIHLKIIPGAGAATIEEAVSLADAVSLNVETPGQKHLAKLSDKKDYIRDIVEPMRLISRLTARGARYERVKQTTQFIVGAAGESDAEIVKYVWALYDRLKLHRVYFSAYQKGLGDHTIAGESASDCRSPSRSAGADTFMREHRLYQVDFLIRKYGFAESDIVFEENGNLSLTTDPKEAWARRHPEMFPVEINRASKLAILRVPGLGPVTAGLILRQRKTGPIRSIDDIGKVGARLEKARKYLTF